MNIKRFNESIEDEPENGDYILCEVNVKTKLYDFINNNISKLSFSYLWNNLQKIYVIQYEDVPRELKNEFSRKTKIEKSFYECEIARRAIKYWDKDKEKLELILKTNKFNV